MTATIKGIESINCEHVIPSDVAPLAAVSRWSDSKIDSPALVVKPATEEDVQASIRVANENGWKVVVSGGGHGTFVRVDADCLYLDMENLRAVKLNKEAGLVEVGGGVKTGDLLRNLADEGYYTPLPNSNAVGVVGCIIGGGNNPFNGLHGWMADNAQSFRLVTAMGKIVEVSAASTREDLALFNALCGGGHGLGVIMSAKIKAYRISDLGMTDNNIWMRSVIFPSAHIDVAARAFLDLQRPPPMTSFGLTFIRSPPGTPAAGSPIIILGGTHFGPADQAESISSVLFREDIVGKASTSKTDMVPMVALNDRYESQNVHGGHKAIASCRLKKTDAETIKSTFEQWVSITQKHPDSQRSILVIAKFNSTKAVELQRTQSAGRFLENRDRDFAAMAVTVCSEEDTRVALAEYKDSVMAAMRKGDAGAAAASFPNNLRFGMDLGEMFKPEGLEELRRIKTTWDANGLFWSPYEH